MTRAGILEHSRCRWAHPDVRSPEPKRPSKRPRLDTKLLMDPPPRAPTFPPGSRASAHVHRTASDSRHLDARGGDGSHPARSESLRREHSDGDVIRPHARASMSNRQVDEETWMDFLRESSRPEEGGVDRHRRRAARNYIDASRQERQRAALVLADRKRRLTESQEHYGRHRSASSLPFGPSTSGQSDRRTATAGHNSSGSEGSITSSNSTERPLPPRPHAPSSRPRASRDITLPRWQPDSEVTKCPICNTSFGFWYRKHHCRKCGRVVCASCSPHRITIPRQFIVQPPQDSTAASGNGTPANIEVVDLTGNDDDPDEPPQNSELRDTPRSPISRIDPALGGGQEVRLCNPCVPDPNPLPHLNFDPSRAFGIDSFANLGADSPSASSNNHGVSSFSRRLSAARRNYNTPDRAGLDVGDEAADSTPGSRSLHRFGPVPPQRLTRYNTPPNYSALYGSVPNPSLND
ncbi:MAG: hypothetical protein Q9174_001997, partial [Haloplaca sp. 1 TL-2023]